jgi:HPt (histidine-containing phosphotransfer) domain-containing protein
MGDLPEEVYDAIVQSCYEESRARLKELKVVLDNRDWATAARMAHAIKGSAGNLHLTAVFEAAKKLEFSAKAGQADEVQKDFDVLSGLIP